MASCLVKKRWLVITATIYLHVGSIVVHAASESDGGRSRIEPALLAAVAASGADECLHDRRAPLRTQSRTSTTTARDFTGVVRRLDCIVEGDTYSPSLLAKLHTDF